MVFHAIVREIVVFCQLGQPPLNVVVLAGIYFTLLLLGLFGLFFLFTKELCLLRVVGILKDLRKLLILRWGPHAFCRLLLLP